MPVWTHNKTAISGKGMEKTLSLVKEYIDDRDKGFFSRFIPIPKALRKEDLTYKEICRNKEKYGYGTMSDYCKANWGTESEPENMAYELRGDELFLTFDTVEDPPTIIWYKLAVDNPEMRIMGLFGKDTDTIPFMGYVYFDAIIGNINCSFNLKSEDFLNCYFEYNWFDIGFPEGYIDQLSKCCFIHAHFIPQRYPYDGEELSRYREAMETVEGKWPDVRLLCPSFPKDSFWKVKLSEDGKRYDLIPRKEGDFKMPKNLKCSVGQDGCTWTIGDGSDSSGEYVCRIKGSRTKTEYTFFKKESVGYLVDESGNSADELISSLFRKNKEVLLDIREKEGDTFSHYSVPSRGFKELSDYSSLKCASKDVWRKEPNPYFEHPLPVEHYSCMNPEDECYQYKNSYIINETNVNSDRKKHPAYEVEIRMINVNGEYDDVRTLMTLKEDNQISCRKAKKVFLEIDGHLVYENWEIGYPVQLDTYDILNNDPEEMLQEGFGFDVWENDSLVDDVKKIGFGMELEDGEILRMPIDKKVFEDIYRETGELICEEDYEEEAASWRNQCTLNDIVIWPKDKCIDHIGASENSVDSSCFEDVDSLRWIDVNDNNDVFCSIDGCLYSKDHKTLFFVPPQKVKGEGLYFFSESDNILIFPKRLETVSPYAFMNNDVIEYVVLNDGFKGTDEQLKYIADGREIVVLNEESPLLERLEDLGIEICEDFQDMDEILLQKNSVTLDGADEFGPRYEDLIEEELDEDVDERPYAKNYYINKQIEDCPIGEYQNWNDDLYYYMNGQYSYSLDNFSDSIYIPDYVTDIGSFRRFKKLESIVVDDDNECYASFDGALYNKDLTQLLVCPQRKNSITFPPTLKSIDKDAFYECYWLDGFETPVPTDTKFLRYKSDDGIHFERFEFFWNEDEGKYYVEDEYEDEDEYDDEDFGEDDEEDDDDEV